MHTFTSVLAILGPTATVVILVSLLLAAAAAAVVVYVQYNSWAMRRPSPVPTLDQQLLMHSLDNRSNLRRNLPTVNARRPSN